MDELIDYLRNNTHLTRLTRPEIRELIARMGQDGWEIVRKADRDTVIHAGAVAQGEAESEAWAELIGPEPEPEPETETNDPAEQRDF